MGEGLQRAALTAILSRGPWVTLDGEVTAENVAAVYDAVRTADQETGIRAGAIGAAAGITGRQIARALQLLRKARLIRFASPGWVVVPHG